MSSVPGSPKPEVSCVRLKGSQHGDFSSVLTAPGFKEGFGSQRIRTCHKEGYRYLSWGYSYGLWLP